MATTPASSARVSPAREDPVVAGASQFIGGPPGEHAVIPVRRTWLTPLRVLMALVIVASVLGYTQKVSCRDTRNWTHEHQYTYLCYSDVVALYSQEGLVDGKVPYLDYPTEYPPIIGAAMQLISWPAGLASGPRAVYREDNGQRVFDHYTMDRRSAVFYDLTALLFMIAACVAVACTALTAGSRRVWDAALFAVAPALVLHLLTNWDILAVAFAAGGLLAWSRRAPKLAGLLLGLGILTKLYPALFLVAIALLCLRTGRMRELAKTVGAALATVVVVIVPLWLSAGYFNAEHQRVGASIWSTFWSGGHWIGLLGGGSDGARNGVARFFDLNADRGADWDSLAFGATWLAGRYDPGWFGPLHLVISVITAVAIATAATAGLYHRPDARRLIIASSVAGWVTIVIGVPVILQGIRDNGISTPTLNVITAAALAIAVLAIGLLTWFAPRRPRLPQVIFLLVVAFLVTNKVFSPQYTIWLLPLVALARPRWRLFLLWQACEAWVLFTRFMHFIYNDTSGRRGIDRGWFVGAVALRDLVLVILAGFVVREILHPHRDIVRSGGVAVPYDPDDPGDPTDPDIVDDPAGGVLDHAPDVRGGRLAWSGARGAVAGWTEESAAHTGGLPVRRPGMSDFPGAAGAIGAPGRTTATGSTATASPSQSAVAADDSRSDRPEMTPIEPGALFKPRRTQAEEQPPSDSPGADRAGPDGA